MKSGSATADGLPASAPTWDLERVVADLRAARHRWRESQQRNLEVGGRELPAREAVRDIVTALAGALFPMRLGPPDLRQETEDFYVGHTLDAALTGLLLQVRLELRHAARGGAPAPAEIDLKATEIVRHFAASLPGIRGALDNDVLAAYRGDPAAHSVDEVLLCYPGIVAVTHYRLANVLWSLGVPLLARLVTELAHTETGIDIHPGARIGGSFFIDHGTGVVIGETTIIGERVRIYQAVTLGAKSFPASDDGHLHKGLPRHPIVEDDVVIYAGATILGRITIGRGSTIGGNVWVTHNVAPGSHVTQASSQHDPAAGSADAA
jgi:serine O-acetyltransferase